MNPLSNNPLGFALILDFDGNIKEIKYSANDTIHFMLGKNVVHYIEKSSTERFFDAFNEAKTNGYSLGQEVAFNTTSNPLTTKLIMTVHNHSIIFMSLGEDEHTMNIIDEILKINSFQTNQIRASYEQSAMQINDKQTLEQISSLNSELVNTQRSIAQKNQELKRLNDKLKTLSEMDTLTNIGNRRKLFHDLHHTLNLNKHYQLIMLDFNNFKIINDEFGHQKGDETLQYFTTLVNENIKNYNGELYRIGGDEFVLIIEETKEFDTQKLTDFLNDKMEKIHPELSIAFGAVTIFLKSHNEKTDIEKLLNKADRLMYKNKRKVKR